MAASERPHIASWGELRALWREDYRTNGSRFFEPGFQALAIYRFGVWVDGLRIAMLRWPLRRLYFLLNLFVEVVYGIRLYYTADIGRRLQIAHGQCGLVLAPRSRIGDDCIIRHNVTLGRLGRGTPEKDVPRLGDRVEIGAGAVLIGSIAIGDDVLIGPNVVVREDVPPATAVLSETPRLKPRHNRRSKPALTSV